MDHDVWEVCACLQFVDGDLLDKKKPFKTYYVEADSAENAVQKMKEDFACCNVTLSGKPIHSIVKSEDYENG